MEYLIFGVTIILMYSYALYENKKLNKKFKKVKVKANNINKRLLEEYYNDIK